MEKEVTECDENEAPSGYYAIPKASLTIEDNFCNHCDWRKQCQSPDTDHLAYGHRCSDYAVVATRDGKEYQREDKCSVLFKKREQGILF